MSTFFRGITEAIPSLFRGIFSEQNSVANPNKSRTPAVAVDVARSDDSNPEDSAKARFHATARMKATLKKPTQQQTAFLSILVFVHKLADLWSCSLPKLNDKRANPKEKNIF
jgi:hypothetical protein